MSEQQEEYTQSPNPKLTIMWEQLSQQRQGEINKMLIDTIKSFERSGKLEVGKIYPFELTNAFDKEEPKQYVYLYCAFRIKQLEKSIVVNKDLPPATSTMDIAMQDIEVFKEESMSDWLDHVNRIEKNNSENKENQLFYEDNIFEKNKKVEEKKDNKKETVKKNKNINQCKINRAVDEKDMKLDGEGVMVGSGGIFTEHDKLDKGYQHADNNNNNNNNNNNTGTNIHHGISKKDLFDFYEKDEPQRTNEKYISIFKIYSRSVINSTMIMYYNHKLNDEKSDGNVLSYLKNLQVSFSNCDFWKFNRYELGQLGFINWSDELLLIPVWAFPVILKNSKDKKVYTPACEEMTVRDIDVHENPMIKYGCVPFGFKIEELKS